ncbi:MarR family winged helix-turn-helix transcriptional regulator [Streptomyces sp. TLI_171]|uniref:MarR family winged helix-turn-helix transcriptional regulator n=1 Tax=Streptomyces sp. TLI_171 TaxID=1938859 RepID=UPI000C680D3F|nr:MarR family transcriptional regulator [Streptomyces sp. TLI_171]RKE22644.1 DNA-binding MarR family transcriptional regulator [Streptomyces sp. TLI_171]
MGMPASDRLGVDLHRADQELLAAKRAAVEPAGLTVPQYAALYVLAENAGISGAALARSCQVTPQAMAVLLKLLTERGLVERAPHRWHRNVLETRLTDRGRAALDLADGRATAVEQALRAEFTPAEAELLRALLSRATDALRRAAEGLD